MKDPLQTEATPYEILGVARDASADAVERGFRQGLVERQNVPRLTAAKRALQDPVERAVVDALLYDPDFVGRMAPNPAADPDALTTRRDLTGQAWAQALVLRFPDLGMLHCCSVFWYWSALGHPDSSKSKKNWAHAIGGWTSLLASDAFRARLGPRADEVATRIEERLRGRLRDRQQGETEAGRADEALSYRDLELELDAELRSARRVAAAGLRLGHGTLTSGPLLLELLNLSELIRRQLDAALRQNPSHPALLSVQASLFSPVARVEALIEANDPEQAIALIEALPERERSAAELQRALAMALHALGRRQADLEKTSEALAAWADGIRVADDELAERIRADVRSMCLSRAAAWQASRADDAIALLNRGLQVVRDSKLQQTLAELVAQRGVVRVNEALREADFENKGYTPKLAGPLQAGLKDLEDAERLGSERAAESARQVRSIRARGAWTQRKARRLTFNSLPPAARRRFVECAGARAKPAPLLLERSAGKATPWILVGIACAFSLVVTIAAGFGEARGAHHSVPGIAWYALVMFGGLVAALNLLKSQAEHRLSPFPEGCYLFPLDVVEAKEGTLRVHPTSDLEKFEPIHHHNAGRYTHSVLAFEFKDKARVEFRVNTRARADQVLEALQTANDTTQEALRCGDLSLLRDLDLFPSGP